MPRQPQNEQDDETRQQLIGDHQDADAWSDAAEPLSSSPENRRRSLCKKVLFGCLLFLLVFVSMVIGAWIAPAAFRLNNSSMTGQVASKDKPRNIVMMISDGLGPASVSYSRSLYQYIHKLPYDHPMPLDTIHIGQSRTRSSSTLVTDSAAGATAFSCGLKTYNGAIGVDPGRNPCGTVLESAKYHHRKLTGLVATSRITHATPAAFSAHVTHRDNENEIAAQQIGDYPLGRSVDLMFGGGSCHFLPKRDHRSCRRDNRDLFSEASEAFGWKTVLSIDHNRTEFDNLPVDNVLPLIGLFNTDHMNYEIDRDSAIEPSLSEMSDKALKILSAEAGSENGFFLMIEGSRIDMAAHSNDPVAHLHDILEYQKTVDLVKKFVDEHPDTLLISTSDHETGGLSLARQVSTSYPEYLWYPDVLVKASQSTVILATKILAQNTKLTDDFLLREILEKGLGITDATSSELGRLKRTKSTKRLDMYLAEMISIRAQLGWATHGHSGVDVNLYAYGHQVDVLRGSHENTDIGDFITQMLDLNLDELSVILNEKNDRFRIKELDDEDKVQYTNHLDTYHSNPKNLHHPSLSG